MRRTSSLIWAGAHTADTGDWAISTGQYTRQQVDDTLSGWLSGPKSPGLNILEHELNDNTVGVFMDNYPKMVSNGWTIKSVADAWGMQWYQNSVSNTGDVTSMAVAGNAVSSANASASAGASNSSSLVSRSDSLTSSSSESQSQSGAAQSLTSTNSASVTSAASGSQTAAANAVASASQKSGAQVRAVPGVALAFVGVIAAAML